MIRVWFESQKKDAISSLLSIPIPIHYILQNMSTELYVQGISFIRLTYYKICQPNERNALHI